MNKITPCLWFDHNAEEAISFYLSVFPDGELLSVNRYPEGAPDFAGEVLTAHFRLAGQEFIALNGGPMFQFNEAVSFSIDCKDQAEVDYYWDKLTEGGEESMCGWLKDKFGLWWQVVPSRLGELLYHPDTAKAGKAMQAMFTMRKIDIGELEAAANS